MDRRKRKKTNPSQEFIDLICNLYGDVYDDREEDSKPGGDDWVPGEKADHLSLAAFKKELEEKNIKLSTAKIKAARSFTRRFYTAALAPQWFQAVSVRDSLDWKDYDAQTIYARVTQRVQPGSIVLFHNAALHTPEALGDIIAKLLQDGYTVVPVSELLLSGDTEIDHTGRQMPA